MRAPTILLLMFLFAFRIFLSINAKHGDMYNNISWGKVAVEKGLSGFYELPKSDFTHSRPNQPPGSIIFHYLSIHLSNSTGQLINWSNDQLPIFPSSLVWFWENHGELISIKIFSVLADFVSAWVIYQITKSKKWAFIYLLNPAIWYISSFWGQTDSIVAALSLLSIYFLSSKRIGLSAIFLGLTLITKASWAPLIPLWAVYVYRDFNSKIYKSIFALISAIIVALPFHPMVDLPLWLTNLYASRILPGESAFITVNAFNFWSLFFPTDRFVALPVFPFIGYVLIGLVLCFSASKLLKKTDITTLVTTSTILFFAVFMFSPRMHERYFFPVLPLLTLLLGSTKSWLLRFLYIGVSVLFLLNVYSMWWAPYLASLVNLYTPLFTKAIAFLYLTAFAVQLNYARKA